jgi:hypothetical protein
LIEVDIFELYGLLRAGLIIALYAFLVGVLLFWWREARATRRARARTDSQNAVSSQLVVLTSSEPRWPTGRRIPLAPVFAIGRAPTNHLTLDDATASLEHALIHRRGDSWWIEDLASRNGTRVNGVALSSPVRLAGGDVITVCGLEMRIDV